jgi:hypothetical protein
MATTRPFAYNPIPPNSPIFGTSQLGDLAIGNINTEYSTSYGGVTWWMGPDEDSGYVIVVPNSGGTQPTPIFAENLLLSNTYKGSDITILNNSLTALQQFGYQQSVLGQTLIDNGDKIMFSVQSNVSPPPGDPFFQSIGFGTTSMNYQGNPYGGYPGNDDQSIGFSQDGNFYFNGSIVASSLPTWTASYIIDIAVNLSQGVIWIRVNGGDWNNNPSANPVIGTGGLSVYGLTSFYPVLSPGNNASQMSIETSAQYGIPEGYQLLGTNVTASLGAFGTKNFLDSDFIDLSQQVSSIFGNPQTFTSASQASTWLTNNGFWNSYPVGSVTPTPTATLVSPTPTPTVTSTATSTPTPTPIPVTGYGFNLIAVPYDYPSSGNTIMVDQANPNVGTRNPNLFATNNDGIYFNSIDINGINRTSYYASFTGRSVTVTLSQTGSTAIYSADTNAFQSWISNSGTTGFVLGYGIAQPGYSAGVTTLIQSAATNFTYGVPVYISVVDNNPPITPTPTATSQTPTPTPTQGGPGWYFYSPDNQPVLTAPLNNGNTTFINNGSGNGTYSPNYTGGTLQLYFNNNNSVGTSYSSQFSTLNDSGGTITISQGSSTAVYSGTSTDYQSSGQFLFLNVTRSAQMIQSASTRFVSGSSINVVVS